MRDTDELLATRTVALRFPEGTTQYWLTDRVFAVGDTIERDGRRFIVSDIADIRETGREPRITLQPASTHATPSDVAERDRQAWNLLAAPDTAPAA